MNARLDSIDAVVDAHLCTGCGVCAYLRPDALRMADVDGVGIRPLPIVGITSGVAGDALAACPGRALQHDEATLKDAPFGGEWGPILDLYECWATDPDVRHRGSSGGVVSALAAHAVTSGAAVGALQVQARADAPILNETRLNRSYADIVSAAGSRYSPADPCERLDLVESAEGPSVVVGKPCDIAATRAAADRRPELAEKVGLTIGIFCAGTPSTAGTADLVRGLGIDPADVERLDYRGEGWPGEFRLRTRSGDTRSLSYAESWGSLTKRRQWRCMICPDHTGEFADLSVGDPWYRRTEGQDGRSLVVVRTERGRAALLQALADGAIEGGPLPLDKLPASQPSLESTRGALWGRLLTLRLARVGTPTFRGLPTFRLWLKLGMSQKVSSFAGTVRRIKVRGLRRPEFIREER
ncbi:Coenzyme F420 hydrogenase/dehydrogenase, beta subunit C-terminal domain [Occultella gossypii]|uniref:Coenzyme F420 hydrogenase/dehydrogenase, beta subunit C-terminal domain n=1 Tax=Occultella gossypii TaxID=2800820 RepID=A0ABS7S8P7_9MICO|nr:Coenzyme F420 hydrogenase/dehydrogenase, beta subunit C-terminal domain [Occultella gossypii]MBZ2196726.1 Coenzyme F420 hydrogenase/dehydrogenase, beta subunit C-terminal domain [Occultella gossypii]